MTIELKMAQLETSAAVLGTKIENIESDIKEIKESLNKIAGGGGPFQKVLMGTLIVQSILNGVLDPAAAKVALKTILGSMGG